MHELLAQLETHVRAAWRYRWFGLAAATTVCLLGWAGVMLLPNQFEVTAKVYLDTTSLLRPLLRGLAIDTNVRQEAVQMVRRTLLTRPNLETVVRNTDMDLKARTPEDFEELVEDLGKEVTVVGTERDNIFAIAYENSDPQLATRVVESVLNIMVEKSLGMSRKDTTKTREFIEQQIKEYEAKLEAAESRVKEFRQTNMGLMPSDGASYYQRRESIATQIREAELQLREAERRADSLKRQLEGGELQPTDTMVTEVLSPLDSRIKILEEKLDGLLIQYTERHPDVVSTRKILADLRRERDAERAGLRQVSGAGDPRLARNPVFQQLKLSLTAAEAEVAAIKARVEEYRKREQDLSRLVNTIPQVEAELSRLNRDYDVHKRNYQELVTRREALAISDQAGKTSDEVQFNVVEPPKAPLKPASPDRPQMLTVVLFAGFGAGGGFAWLLGMIRPAVYTREGLAAVAEVPVLGSISRVSTQQERNQRRARVALFILGCLMLVLLFAAVLAGESRIMSLLARLR
jgi:polysaccharide chain length determinant protein (PEP-CTERM system associated)